MWLNLCRKFGYVDFASEEDMQKALELNGKKLMGQEVKLDRARTKDSSQEGKKGEGWFYLGTKFNWVILRKGNVRDSWVVILHYLVPFDLAAITKHETVQLIWLGTFTLQRGMQGHCLWRTFHFLPRLKTWRKCLRTQLKSGYLQARTDQTEGKALNGNSEIVVSYSPVNIFAGNMLAIFCI